MKGVGIDGSSPADVSIVVPTLGRPERALSLSCILAELDPQPLEVLFVFQDVDEERTFAERQRGRGITSLLADRRSAGYARNWGLRHARGSIVAFIDDDCTPCGKEWLLDLVRPLGQPGIRLATGAVHGWDAVSGRFPLFKKAFRLLPPFLEPVGRPDSAIASTCDTVAGGNFAGRTAELLSVGGFSEAFSSPSLFEETELSLRMLRRYGGAIAFVPQAGVHHDQEESGGMRANAVGFSTDFVDQQRWILLREVYGESAITRMRFKAYLASRWLTRRMG